MMLLLSSFHNRALKSELWATPAVSFHLLLSLKNSLGGQQHLAHPVCFSVKKWDKRILACPCPQIISRWPAIMVLLLPFWAPHCRKTVWSQQCFCFSYSSPLDFPVTGEISINFPDRLRAYLTNASSTHSTRLKLWNYFSYLYLYPLTCIPSRWSPSPEIAPQKHLCDVSPFSIFKALVKDQLWYFYRGTTMKNGFYIPFQRLQGEGSRKRKQVGPGPRSKSELVED